jgi:hypothetical protein
METIYFILGMLSIIGAAFVATVVWGVVKISKLLKAIKEQEQQSKNIERDGWENLNHLRQDLDRRLDEIGRHSDHHVTELQRELDIKFNNTVSYVDSRIDKMSAALKEQKQVIKG